MVSGTNSKYPLFEPIARMSYGLRYSLRPAASQTDFTFLINSIANISYLKSSFPLTIIGLADHVLYPPNCDFSRILCTTYSYGSPQSSANSYSGSLVHFSTSSACSVYSSIFLAKSWSPEYLLSSIVKIAYHYIKSWFLQFTYSNLICLCFFAYSLIERLWWPLPVKYKEANAFSR